MPTAESGVPTDAGEVFAAREPAPALQRAAFLLVWLFITCAASAAPRTSANYSVPAETLDAGGARSASDAYTNDGSFGEVGDVSTAVAPAVTAKHGFMGQLYEVTGLQLAASPATVDEGLMRQITAAQVLDDTTLVIVASSSVTWSVVSGPLVGIDANGVVTAAKVHADTPAVVQGSFLGLTDTLDLTVLNTATDFLAFSSTLYTVNEEGVAIGITVLRTGSTDGTVTVNFSTSSAGATATAGADYTTVTNQLVTFVHGDASETVNVPILPGNAVNETNETFTVTLSSPGAGAALGAPATATVRIVDPGDVTAPSAPVITFPTANALLSNLVNAAAQTTVTGTAVDNKGVGSVKVKLNTGGFVDAAITLTGTGTTANWSLPITPLTGSNTVAVQTFDTRGNGSSIVTRTFKVLRPLLVNVDTAQFGGVTTGFAGTTYREVGKSHTITATAKTTPAPGAIFTGWTLSGDDAAQGDIDFTPQRIGVATSALEKNTLTFIFREGLVLTANFIANPFAPMAGSYQGLIRPSATQPDRPTPQLDGTTRSNSTEGLFKATVTNTGGFSGTLTIDGTVLNVAGAFDHNGNARFGTARALTLTVARLNKPSLVVALHLDMVTPGTGDNITGTVTATDFKKSVTTAVSNVNADKAFYGFQTLAGNGITTGSAVVTLGSTLGRFEGEVVTGTGIPANTTIQTVDSLTQLTLTANATTTNAAASLTFTRNVPSAYLGAANANGIFTAVFPAEDVGSQTAGFTTQDYPQGDGYATITVTKAGVITIAGTLADNTAISMTSALSQANMFPLFVQLYTKLGFVSGMVQLDSTQTTSDMAAADLQWLRPFIGTSHYYPYGWPEVIKVDLMAAKYAVVANQSVLKAANGVNIQATVDEDGNAALAFSDGQLSETLNKSAYLSLADVVTKVPDNDPTFTLMVTRTTGAISGTITHTDDTVPTYKGIIFQKGPNAGAYGFFLTKQPVPIDYTGESGGVSLIGQP